MLNCTYYYISCSAVVWNSVRWNIIRPGYRSNRMYKCIPSANSTHQWNNRATDKWQQNYFFLLSVWWAVYEYRCLIPIVNICLSWVKIPDRTCKEFHFLSSKLLELNNNEMLTLGLSEKLYVDIDESTFKTKTEILKRIK